MSHTSICIKVSSKNVGHTDFYLFIGGGLELDQFQLDSDHHGNAEVAHLNVSISVSVSEL